MKVLVSDNFSAEGLRIFEDADGIDVQYRPGISPSDLLEAVAEVDALVVRSGTQVTEDVFQAAHRLKVIGRAGIGVENIDLAAANRKGVVVMTTPFGSTTTTAEHTIAMLLAMARQIPQASRSTKNGQWEKHRFLGVEVSGKTLGVIGAGKIGRLVIERALALKMQVVVYDPYLAAEMVHQIGAELVELEDLLNRADFITLHIPLNSETQNLLDADTLARTRPGCRIINCAIGGLIDEPRAAIHGVTLDPAVVVDLDRLSAAVAHLASTIDRKPTDAPVSPAAGGTVTRVPRRDGRAPGRTGRVAGRRATSP